MKKNNFNNDNNIILLMNFTRNIIKGKKWLESTWSFAILNEVKRGTI